MNDEERAEQGMAVRRAVLGDAHVDRAAANTTEFSAPFQDWITRYAWGEIWSRPGLSRPQRSIVTLTVLAALQHEDELAMHTKAALRNGLTVDEIREVLLQVGLYAGVPLRDVLLATPDVADKLSRAGISAAEIEQVLNPGGYLGASDAFIAAALAAHHAR